MKATHSGVFYNYQEAARLVHLAEDLSSEYPNDKGLHLLWRLLDQYAYSEHYNGFDIANASIDDLI